MRTPLLLGLLVLVGSGTRSHAQVAWREATQLNLQMCAMAFDTGRGRVVLFGSSYYGAAAQTWEWVGGAWVARVSTHRPPGRVDHALAYDAARKRTVLFGGFSVGTTYSDLWEWDGQDWTQRFPATSPSRRSRHAMAYDVARARVVLFGGLGDSYLSDTWEWDGTNWTARNPAKSPPPRDWHALAHDPVRGRTVLFGGWSQGLRVADTWEWDGVNWTLLSPTASPPARFTHALAWHAGNARILLFGGSTGSATLSDTWEWDGASWLQRAVSTSPPARCYLAMAGDSTRGRTVMFGGAPAQVAPEVLFDTWEWDGNQWLAGPSSAPPDGGSGSALVSYDAARSRVVLFDTNGSGPGTWEWNGARWQSVPTTTSPGTSVLSAMAFDFVRGRSLVFGGGYAAFAVADTWDWDGGNWTLLNPSQRPSVRGGHAMASDPVRRRVVMFGGIALPGENAETWEWDGSTWSQKTPAQNPSPRYSHQMVYDAARGRVLLYGGIHANVSLTDTWEWDGAVWTQKSAVGPPQPRGGWLVGMAYDSRRGRVVTYSEGTWEWDGTSWTKSSAYGGALYPGPLVDDPVRGSMLMVSGYRAAVWLSGGGTWLYDDPRVTPRSAVSAFGRGCPGRGGEPVVAASDPKLGSPSMFIDILAARPSSMCAVGLAATSQTLVLGGGCTFYLGNPALAFATTSGANGLATVGFVLPNDPSLAGGAVFAQGFVLDPLGAFSGIACTGGVALTLAY